MWHFWYITLRQRQYTLIALYIWLRMVIDNAYCLLKPRLLSGWEPAGHGYLLRLPRFYTGIWSYSCYCPSRNRNEALVWKLERHLELLQSTCKWLRVLQRHYMDIFPTCLGDKYVASRLCRPTAQSMGINHLLIRNAILAVCKSCLSCARAILFKILLWS